MMPPKMCLLTAEKVNEVYNVSKSTFLDLQAKTLDHWTMTMVTK